jgi:hypothetical protein
MHYFVNLLQNREERDKLGNAFSVTGFNGPLSVFPLSDVHLCRVSHQPEAITAITVVTTKGLKPAIHEIIKLCAFGTKFSVTQFKIGYTSKVKR